MPRLSRRDFLKISALFPSALMFSNLFSILQPSHQKNNVSTPNVIIVLFDAMSARDLSLYGYHRKTTPNFERFAERANVYHSHYSAGNFTVPGTSSLLTGMYPWTHRAINIGGWVKRSLVRRNIFGLLGRGYQRIAFAQNLLANFVLSQFRDDIDTILPPAAFGVTDHILGDKFRDKTLAYKAFDDFLFKDEVSGTLPASLLLAPVKNFFLSRTLAQNSSVDYPKGLPGDLNYPIRYRLDDLFTGLGAFVTSLKQPYFAYFHLFSPHEPYRPDKEFYGKFVDSFSFVKKPTHRFASGKSNVALNNGRRLYDEYIATLDKEFGRFLDALDRAGIWENSYVILTSDHGEMFERGEKGHQTAMLYGPVVHIPLMISTPGQNERKDVFFPTNSVDVLPTLLHLLGKDIPKWCQGKLLPGLGGGEDPDRVSFTVEAKQNSAFAPIKIGTVAMRKGKYKMIYYTGYEKEDSFELYDLENDPEELTDLYLALPQLAVAMKTELLKNFQDANTVQ